jgi:ABC-type antimicrobial peptide transport system permease subunit
LGIGLNAGVVSVIRALCYHPLPLPGAERLAGITRGHRLLSYTLFEALREQGKSFIDVAAYDPYVPVQVGSTPKAQGGTARASLVSNNYFAVLNTRARAGAAFSAGKEDAGPTVVLSDRLAARYFDRDANPVGAAIRLNQRVFTVIGVMPPEFRGSDLMLPELWVRLRDETLLRPGHDIQQNPENRRLILIGRLKPEVSRMQAQAVLSSVAARVPERDSDSDRAMPLLLSPAVLFPIHSEMRPFLLLLMAPTGLVLLIACANLANLLLARAPSRGKEMATRLALGAGRTRLMRQLITESILLALLGGTAGTLLAAELLHHASGFLGQQAAQMGVVLPPFTLDAQAWGCALTISLFAPWRADSLRH